VLSFVPVPSYPRAKRLWFLPERAVLDNGLPVQFLPFVNLTPLKQISLGMATAVALLRWGWQMRRCPRRLVWTYNLTVPPVIFTLLAARLIGAKVLASLVDINEPGHTVPDKCFYRLDYGLHRQLIPKLDGRIVIADQVMTDFVPTRTTSR
jgi:hypothetical protein